MPKGAVRDHGDAVRFAPRQHPGFDGSLLQMVEDLVAGHEADVDDLPHVLEILHVEVADAPRQHLFLRAKLFEGVDRLFQRIRASPMQEIAVEVVGLEASE